MAFWRPSTCGISRLLVTSTSSSASIARRCLHANIASICRIRRRPNEYIRQYPVDIVFQDGSTATVRYDVPREMIKLPLLLEDCETNAERLAWQLRRKPREVITIKKDETEIKYDQTAYIKAAMGAKKQGAKGKKWKRNILSENRFSFFLIHAWIITSCLL